MEMGLHVPGPAAGKGPQRAARRVDGPRNVHPAQTCRMIENVTLLAAFGAGLLSFISPCVLPLIPGYLSYISGLSLDEMRGTGAAATVDRPDTRRRVLVASLAFILGFSLVFISLGATATTIGQFLLQRLPLF